jgi:hypothetical protein
VTDYFFLPKITASFRIVYSFWSCSTVIQIFSSVETEWSNENHSVRFSFWSWKFLSEKVLLSPWRHIVTAHAQKEFGYYFNTQPPPPPNLYILAINCRFCMGVVLKIKEWFHSQFYFRVVVTSRRSPVRKCTMTLHLSFSLSGEPPLGRRGSRIKAHVLLLLFIQWAWFIMLPCTAGEHRVLLTLTLMCQWGKVDDITRSLIFIRFLFSVVPCSNSNCSRYGHDVKRRELQLMFLIYPSTVRKINIKSWIL